MKRKWKRTVNWSQENAFVLHPLTPFTQKPVQAWKVCTHQFWRRLVLGCESHSRNTSWARTGVARVTLATQSQTPPKLI